MDPRRRATRASALLLIAALGAVLGARVMQPDSIAAFAIYGPALWLAGRALLRGVAFVPTALAGVIYAVGVVLHGGGLARLSPESTGLVLCLTCSLSLLWLRQRQLEALRGAC